MVRAKKHITTFSWTEGLKEPEKKYKKKWVEGPKGKFWVSSVYYDREGYMAMLYVNDNYEGYGIKVLIADLDRDYRLVE